MATLPVIGRAKEVGDDAKSGCDAVQSNAVYPVEEGVGNGTGRQTGSRSGRRQGLGSGLEAMAGSRLLLPMQAGAREHEGTRGAAEAADASGAPASRASRRRGGAGKGEVQGSSG
ncbi:hypothetical protein ZWY2020_014324 [Hordeum vulgare]|nr:hypothetical protein ZWY2020_014324 [Hordeum vulgare]